MCRCAASKPASSRARRTRSKSAMLSSIVGGLELQVDPVDARLEAPARVMHALEELLGLRARRDLVFGLHARLRRDLDQQVALHARVAGEDIAAFDLLRREVGRRFAAVDLPVPDHDLALAAVALAAARRQHIQPGRLHGPEQVRVVVDAHRDIVGKKSYRMLQLCSSFRWIKKNIWNHR